MKKKLFIIPALILVVILGVVLFSCGKEKEKKEETPEEIDIDPGEQEDAQEEESAEAEENSAAENEEDGEAPTLTEEEATALLKEKLDGVSCETVFNDEVNIDGTLYYTYTVLDENGEEIDQMLAVSGFSGEVFVYDISEEKVSDYSGFVYFNPDRDLETGWEGSFTNGKLKCILEPSDENMFEFTLSGGKELVGVAKAAGNTAEYAGESGNLKFTMEGKTLTIEDVSGSSGYAGKYTK